MVDHVYHFKNHLSSTYQHERTKVEKIQYVDGREQNFKSLRMHLNLSHYQLKIDCTYNEAYIKLTIKYTVVP